MTKRTFSKFGALSTVWIQQGFAVLILATMVTAFIKFAWAIAAFTPQNQPTGYVAQPEVTNYILTSGNETEYRSEYEKEYWSGNLYAYPLDKQGNLNLAAERWSGGAVHNIVLQHFDTGRLIATMNDDGISKVPFRLSSLSITQQGYLTMTGYTNQQILDFLRGDRRNEGATRLRVRSGIELSGPVLGDIVHSRPYYVADASTPTVFVGANDGMLHAINTNDGKERWAYIPSMLLPKMKNLATNPYVHDYFVDGQVIIANNVTIGTPNKRVLVGGLGAGGKGLYALDITTLGASTETDVANKILWEITPNKLGYGNLGYTYGTQTIAKVNSAGTPHAVIIGNGYNNAGDFNAYLYVINISDGTLLQSIQAGTSGTSASPNGLFSPAALDTDNNGTVDRVYAGDLNGTMWKFDLSNALPSNWTASVLHTTSPAQPITSTPGVAIHPNGGYMINFGTGAMFTDATLDTTTYYVYGIWDGAPVGNATLVTQTLAERLYGTTRVRRATDGAPNWNSGGHKGWKVALPAGERVVGEGSFIENARFYFNSHNPTISYLVPATTTTIWGENWLMELNYLNGGIGGSATTKPFLDLDGNLLLDDLDRIKYSAASDTPPAGKLVGDPIISPNADGIPVGKWIARGVQSQPLLVQLLTLNTTLFNQNPDVTFPPSPAPASSVGVAGGHFDQDIYYSATSAGSKWSGKVVFDYGTTAKNVTALTIKVGSETIKTGAPGSMTDTALATWVGAVTTANYTTSISTGGGKGTVTITAKAIGAAYNGAITVTATGAASADYTITNNITTGADASSGDPCTTCQSMQHVHQYDDKYDRTGVNMLNASNTTMNLSNAIASTTTNFKVIAQNQYLNPAVKIHIGGNSVAAYVYNVDAGYISIKNFVTSASLDLATLPTYNRSNIGSLAFNLPVDGLTSKDWWRNEDVRAGLHPTTTGCVKRSAGTTDGNMYQPIIPPANGVNGPGTKGWSTTTTPATATGARHGGALVIQIISASTPNSAIEENVPGRPEYGWRVKSASFATYVLAEYTTFWHHPNGMCYGDAGWTKTPGSDTGSSTAVTPAAGSTDPKIGELGAASGCTNLTSSVAVSGSTTTTTTICTNDDGTTTTLQIISRTKNSDGTVTIITKNAACVATPGCAGVTQIVADAAGSGTSGGDERGLQAKTGRISWHELIR